MGCGGVEIEDMKHEVLGPTRTSCIRHQLLPRLACFCCFPFVSLFALGLVDAPLHWSPCSVVCPLLCRAYRHTHIHIHVTNEANINIFITMAIILEGGPNPQSPP